MMQDAVQIHPATTYYIIDSWGEILDWKLDVLDETYDGTFYEMVVAKRFDLVQYNYSTWACISGVTS